MKQRNITLMEVLGPIMKGNLKGPLGTTEDLKAEYLVELDEFISDPSELSEIVVGLKAGRPVYLKDVARVIDGPEVRKDYVLFGKEGQALESAVTISLSKRPGTNATVLAKKVHDEVISMRGSLIPDGVGFTVTRDYGKTAQEKSNELIKHLLIASISVVVFIAITLGIRFSLVVGIAVPVTLALTLLIYYLFGYTLNRVTLFALIFSIGILVDDAIVVVENIQRHFKLYRKKRTFRDIVIRAVNEVGDPTILATFTVIAAILPMAFVSGLMGPYMRPIPVGASIAMLFSISLVIHFLYNLPIKPPPSSSS
jgi:multidrug efflux pump subunit AcrB